MSLSFNWVRRDFKRLFWTDNVLVSFDDYTVINIPNPVVAGEMIPIYNLNRRQARAGRQIDKNSSQNSRWYNGFDVGFSARARRRQHLRWRASAGS